VLKSSPETGLDLKTNPTQLTQRAEVFGLNAIAPKKLTTFLEFCWDAIQDFVLIMLICLGVVSIIVETTIGDHADHCTTCWVEGAAILVAVCIVVLVTATIDYQKQKTFVKLSKTLDDTSTKTVIRNGEMVSVVDGDIVVGDILSVNSHNLATISADCILLGGGSQLKVDESSLTGESKLVSKKPGDVVLSGTTAVQGSGKMVVIAVGIHSVAGKIKARVYEAKAATTSTASSNDEGDAKKKKKVEEEEDLEGDEETPLFSKLTVLAKQIGIAGTIAACVAFVASLILGLAVKEDPPSMIVEYFITAVTVLAVAVPEGLPLAVTLALAFSSSKMTSEQNLVKHLDACETMGCATTICTDKTGTLTANKMTARAIMIGDGQTVNIIHNDPSTTLADEMLKKQDSESTNSIPTSILKLLANLISIATMNETVLQYGKKGEVNSSNGNHATDKKKNPNGESNIVASSSNKHKDDLVVTGSEGNPTECALLHLVDDLGFRYQTLRNETRGRSDAGDLARFLGEGKQFDFTSARKMMSWAVPKVDPITKQKLMGSDGGYRIYSKGAAEVIASRCSKMLIVPTNDFDNANQEEDGGEETYSKFEVVDMTPELLTMLNRTSEKYARRGMRCLSLAFRDLPTTADWEALSDEIENSDGTKAFEVETELTFVALVGIEDPLRKDVPRAIQQCYEAGIDVRMVTGDNPNTAVSIAHQAGILRDEHFMIAEGEEHPEYIAANLKPNVMLEGKEFRARVYRTMSSTTSMVSSNNVNGTSSNNKKEFDQAEFDRIWPHLRVLARSSPDDKLTLAHGLNQSTLYTDKQKCKVLLQEDNIRIFPDRQVVAMTGDGTNDAPALKRADIGFAMGLSGTQIAKDAADIILLDDNFASIVTAAKWGRNVYASIQKFLQFQLTVNIAAVTTALVGAFAFQTSPLAAIQLLWVNLLMDSLASLALASEPPTEELLKKPPVNRSDAMITKRMWANMIGHAIYQIVVVLTLLFDAPRWFGFTPGYSSKNTVHFTLIFNSFVWMQLFNEINCRNLKGEHNVFKGVFRNPLFCGVWITTAFLQVIIVQFGSVAMSVAEGGLNAKYWGISIAFGLGSFPIQQVINVIYRLVEKYKIVRDRKRHRKASHMLRQNISEEHM
jgi:Ca2+ transporting ATPase